MYFTKSPHGNPRCQPMHHHNSAAMAPKRKHDDTEAERAEEDVVGAAKPEAEPVVPVAISSPRPPAGFYAQQWGPGTVTVTVRVAEDVTNSNFKTIARFGLVLQTVNDTNKTAELLAKLLLPGASHKLSKGSSLSMFDPLVEPKGFQFVQLVVRACQLALQFPRGAFSMRVAASGDSKMDIRSEDVASPLRMMDGEPVPGNLDVRREKFLARKEAMLDATQRLCLSMSAFDFKYTPELVKAFKHVGSGFIGTLEDMKELGVSCQHPCHLLLELLNY